MHFAEIHKLVAGDPGAAPIDGPLRTMQQLQQNLSSPPHGGFLPVARVSRHLRLRRRQRRNIPRTAIRSTVIPLTPTAITMPMA